MWIHDFGEDGIPDGTNRIVVAPLLPSPPSMPSLPRSANGSLLRKFEAQPEAVVGLDDRSGRRILDCERARPRRPEHEAVLSASQFRQGPRIMLDIGGHLELAKAVAINLQCKARQGIEFGQRGTQVY